MSIGLWLNAIGCRQTTKLECGNDFDAAWYRCLIIINVIMSTRAISLKAISLKSFAMENAFMWICNTFMNQAIFNQGKIVTFIQIDWAAMNAHMCRLEINTHTFISIHLINCLIFFSLHFFQNVNVADKPTRDIRRLN